MKKILLSILIIVPYFTFSQLIDELPKDENGKLYYSEVVTLDSTILKDEIYLRSKQFFVNTFKSAKDVIQLDDKEAGIIIGKGISIITFKVALGIINQSSLGFTIKISCKNGKYKYEIYDIQDAGSPIEIMFIKENYYKSNGQPRSLYEKYKIEMTKEISALILEIKNSMNKPVVSNETKDNW